MTTVQNIPEELLLIIFNNLTSNDLVKCQYVCRSWHFPARVTSMKSVCLKNVNRTKKFINAINQETNPRFLGAVKEIVIKPGNYWNFTEKAIHNLFFRFPNLESVTINPEFSSTLNDSICKSLLQYCPKLADFRIIGDEQLINDADLCKTRLLLTELELLWGVRNIEQFATRFPRLKSLRVADQTFESLLPVLASLPDLKKICFDLLEKDDDGFLERCLQSKSQVEKELLLKRISQIDELGIFCPIFLSEYLLKIIAKYMSGLKCLKINTILTNQVQLCHTLFKFAQSINDCQFELRMKIDTFWEHFEGLSQQVFQDSVQERILHLTPDSGCFRSGPSIFVDTSKTTRRMKILLSDLELLHERTLLDSVLELDSFVLDISMYDTSICINTYDVFFRTKSTCKQVTLDISRKLLGNRKLPKENITNNHTSVEKLTIKMSTPRNTVQPILDRCLLAFPNLRLLTFDNYCGVWLKALSEYQLVLAKFTLEKLVIDVSYIIRNAKEEQFIVTEVEVLSLNSKYLYKVPLDLSKSTKIDDEDLKGVICGEDYILLNITVGSLQYLELYKPDFVKTYTSIQIE